MTAVSCHLISGREKFCVCSYLPRDPAVTVIQLLDLVDGTRIRKCVLKDEQMQSVLFSDYQYLPLPFPFGRICFVVLVMRKGGESS